MDFARATDNKPSPPSPLATSHLAGTTATVLMSAVIAPFARAILDDLGARSWRSMSTYHSA